MQTLSVLTDPSPSLRQRSLEVPLEDIGQPAFQTFLDDLIHTMFVEDGVGIAAPQVGVNQRIFVVNEKNGPLVYINPVVIPVGDTLVDSEEGCLSVPTVWGIVPRHKRVRLSALNRHGRAVTVESKNFFALVYQHELDHLDGILFIDRATRLTKRNAKQI